MSAAWFPTGLGKRTQNKTSGVWEVFVQVLLPLVLLLTFVAAQMIKNYSEETQKAEQRAAALEIYAQSLPNRDADSEFQGKQQALLDLQYQILLNALQQIETDTRAAAKLTLFPEGANGIQRNKAKITDPRFQALCKYAMQYFNTNDGSQKFRNAIYKILIEKVEKSDQIQEVSSDGWIVPEHVNLLNLPKMDANSFRIANPKQVTDVNRAKIHNEIIEFTIKLRDDVETIQDDLLGILAAERIASPEGLDQESKELVREVTDPTTDAQRREMLVKEFIQRMTKKWRKELEDDNYIFLNTLWEKYHGK